MTEPKYISLHFGSDGSLLAEQGVGFPMFFVPGNDIPKVFAREPEKGPVILSGMAEVAMIGSLLPAIIDIRSFNELPPGIPPDTPAFQLRLRNKIGIGYFGNPKALYIMDWLATLKIDVVITPRNVRMANFRGITQSSEIIQDFETWNDRIANCHLAQIPDVDAAWKRTVKAYHDMAPR